jgi:DNA-directed RNA polymerase specialized sigma24 family protein
MSPGFPSGPAGFPDTRQSLLHRLTGSDTAARERALDVLCTNYWRPAYQYIRLRWGLEPAQAQDLTQGFFLHLLDTRTLERYDRRRARFRTYLRLCLDGYCANRHAAARRLKRGGAVRLLSLDAMGAEADPVERASAGLGDPDAWFHREWVRDLFERSIAALRRRLEAAGKSTHFALFQRYDVDGPGALTRPTYGELAAEFGLPPTQVTNFLALARREFRTIVLEQLRELSADDAEFREEARDLLGWSPDDPAV